MPDFTVTAVQGTGKPWHNKAGQGPFIPHHFTIEGENRTIEWSRKEGSPGPQVGDVLTGDLEDRGGNFPMKFKKAQQQGGGGGGSWRPTPPEEIAAMRRAGAQNRAIATLDVMQRLGLTERINDRNSLLTAIDFLIDYFDGDVKTVYDAAKGAG